MELLSLATLTNKVGGGVLTNWLKLSMYESAVTAIRDVFASVIVD